MSNSQTRITTKKFSHCCEGSRPQDQAPRPGHPAEELGILWNLTLKMSETDYRASIGWEGAENLGGHKQNLMHTRTQEKGPVTPQETEAELPVTV